MKKILKKPSKAVISIEPLVTKPSIVPASFADSHKEFERSKIVAT